MRRHQITTPVPDFIHKLYSMIQTYPDIISFSEDGAQVHIHDYNIFANQMLERYFRHRKWRSFVRQMNMYNFKKINRGIRMLIFANPIFKKGNERNYSKIKRRINTKQQQQQQQLKTQQQLKILLTIECQNARIVMNQSMPVLPFTQTKLVTQQPAAGNLNTIISPQSINPSPPAQCSFSPSPTSYTNSLLYFSECMLNFRRSVAETTSKIKQNIQYLYKERKNQQSKNVNNIVKQSIQMMDEISNKYNQKIEEYTDTGLVKNNQFDSQVDVMGYFNAFCDPYSYNRVIKNQSNQNNNYTNRRSRTAQLEVDGKNSKVVLSVQLPSFSSSSSMSQNPIIPQPIIMTSSKQTNNKGNDDKQMIKKISIQNSESNKKSNSSITGHNLNINEVTNFTQGNVTNTNYNGNDNIIIQNNNNIINNDNCINNGIGNRLGLSLYCSFNSVSNLLNL